MVKTVSATEAKNRLGSLLSESATTNEPVFIETRGRPGNVLLSAGRYEELQEFERQAKLGKLREVLDRIQEINSLRTESMSQEELDQLAIDEVMANRREQRAKSGNQRRVAEETPDYDAE